MTRRRPTRRRPTRRSVAGGLLAVLLVLVGFYALAGYEAQCGSPEPSWSSGDRRSYSEVRSLAPAPAPAPAVRRLVVPPPPLDRPPTGPGSRRARKGTERAHYQDLQVLAKTDRDAFKNAVKELLSEPHATPRQVAAMRVWYDMKFSPRFDPFERVLGAAASRSELIDFALRFLRAKARREADARAALGRYLDSRPQVVRHRAEAVYPLLRWANDAELRSRMPRLYEERDPSVLSEAARGLEASDTPSARWFLEELGYRLSVTSPTQRKLGHSDEDH